MPKVFRGISGSPMRINGRMMIKLTNRVLIISKRNSTPCDAIADHECVGQVCQAFAQRGRCSSIDHETKVIR